MDRLVFIRDIDDWELYAKGLEAHVGRWSEQLQTLYEDTVWQTDTQEGLDNAVTLIKCVLCDVRWVLHQAADRLARLQERSAIERDGLAEHELDPTEP